MIILVLYAAMAAYTPDWKKVEADNGSVYLMDMNSIVRGSNGGAEMTIYRSEGRGYNPRNLRRFIFDCDGHFMDSIDLIEHYAPPKSIAGRMSAVACH